MAHHNAGFMAVSQANLPKTPLAFQGYVRAYFTEVQIGSEIYYVAIRTDGSIEGRRHHEKGVAPSHNVEVDEFKGGLDEGERLSDWIRREQEKARKGHPSLIFSFSRSWNDGCLESMIGD